MCYARPVPDRKILIGNKLINSNMEYKTNMQTKCSGSNKIDTDFNTIIKLSGTELENNIDCNYIISHIGPHLMTTSDITANITSDIMSLCDDIFEAIDSNESVSTIATLNKLIKILNVHISTVDKISLISKICYNVFRISFDRNICL